MDFSAELIEGFGDFQRAQHINHSFIELYKLVAQGRISPRRAAVLTYIGSYILRSLKYIDYDNDQLLDEPDEADNTEPEILDEAEDNPVAADKNDVPPGKKPLPATGAEFAAEVLALAGKTIGPDGRLHDVTPAPTDMAPSSTDADLVPC